MKAKNPITEKMGVWKSKDELFEEMVKTQEAIHAFDKRYGELNKNNFGLTVRERVLNDLEYDACVENMLSAVKYYDELKREYLLKNYDDEK